MDHVCTLVSLALKDRNIIILSDAGYWILDARQEYERQYYIQNPGSNIGAIIKVSLRGERFLARHCEPPIEPGAKQSQLLSVCLLRKYLARNRLRNLAVKDEIAALPAVARNDKCNNVTCIRISKQDLDEKRSEP